MGNNPSSTSKPTTPVSSAGGSTPAGYDSQSPRHSRRDTRTIISPHTTHRSVAPPEASLAQAQGSTVVSRPKSLPGTAVSSLSGSPHGSLTGPTPIAHQQQHQGGGSASASESYSHAGMSSKPPESSTAEGSGSGSASIERDIPSKPVDVPVAESSSLRSQQAQPHAHYNSDMINYSDQNLVSRGSITEMYLTHPPRLPLPIEEEIHTPGSPILAPQEGGDVSDVQMVSSSDALTRKSSGLSAGTVEEEESEELPVDKTRPVVPTKLEWKQGGEKVYVTGTIFQWNRKHRLHPVEGKPGWFAATVHILPGTHHLRFLVDGIMQTSPNLPTTVDFGNNLVNFIEVNPEDALQKQKQAAPAAPKMESSEAEVETRASRSASQSKEPTKVPRTKPVHPPQSYAAEIPQYLLDFDQPEDSPAYLNAVAAIEKLPTPPSLPGFLGKPILNAAVLIKDDNSVLNMPNHTVLNHLATSSIKNNILAVSATTRYMNKYVTTIIYKPTSTDD